MDHAPFLAIYIPDEPDPHIDEEDKKPGSDDDHQKQIEKYREDERVRKEPKREHGKTRKEMGK